MDNGMSVEQIINTVESHLTDTIERNLNARINTKITNPSPKAVGNVLTWNGVLWVAAAPTGGGGGGYNLIQDEGAPLTARTTINFVGGGVTASDSGALTTVTIPTQQAYATVQDEGVALTQRTTIDFVGGAVTVTDTGAKTQVSIPTAQAYATIQDEGIALTQRTTVNFTGAGVTASDSGAVTTVNVPGGAGTFAITEIEVYFGAGQTWADLAATYVTWATLSAAVTSWAALAAGLKGTYSENFLVVDAAVTASSKIMVTQSGKAGTGRVGDDDAEWDAVSYAATPGTGQFQLRAMANPGPITGNRKLLYTLA
jgi:hypothetical protein